MIFALGEADLQTPLHGYASDLAETLKKESDAWTRMSIIGFAETSESELHGSDLSEKRARTVRDFLLAQGLPEERLSVAAPDANSSQTLSQQRVDLLLFGSSLDKLKGIATRISEKHSTDTLSLRLEVLTMDKSKVEVGSKGRTFLIALGKLLKAHDDQWQSLIVKGFTDTRGSADVNHRVARQRGETQAAILINEGLSADRIKSMGIVTSILLDPQDPTSHWNRRAEIEIYGVKDAKELKAQIEALGGS
jgi:outer membrane protein OmpA-like peptidoglycan-associated protein